MLIVSNYANAHHNDTQEFLPTLASVPDELIPQITSSVAELNNFYTQQKISKKRFIERGNIQWNLFLEQ